jgi:6-phosphogluconolactonase/glucosamine-6-phosphate isomerase/deaminase
VIAPLNTRVFATREEVARAAAALITHTLAAKPEAVLGLPAGQTPVPVYTELR